MILPFFFYNSHLWWILISIGFCRLWLLSYIPLMDAIFYRLSQVMAFLSFNPLCCKSWLTFLTTGQLTVFVEHGSHLVIITKHKKIWVCHVTHHVPRDRDFRHLPTLCLPWDRHGCRVHNCPHLPISFPARYSYASLLQASCEVYPFFAVLRDAISADRTLLTNQTPFLPVVNQLKPRFYFSSDQTTSNRRCSARTCSFFACLLP